MGIQKLNKDNFASTIKNSEKLIMINFYAEWSVASRMVAEAMEEMVNENDDVEVYKVDIDEQPELAKEYSVEAVPTIISFKDGRVYKREEGSQHKEYHLNTTNKIRKLDKNSLPDTIRHSEKLVMVKFYADWCETCKALSKTMEEIHTENGDIEVFKINIDEEPELAAKYAVISIPTVISFRNGELYKRIAGGQTKQNILDSLLSIQKLNQFNFIRITRNPSKLKIVYFYKDDSKPCKLAAQVIEEIAEEDEDIEVFKVNIDEQPELSRRFSVKTVPTLLSFKNGDVYRRSLGTQAKKYILDALKGINNLDSSNFDKIIKKSTKTVMVDFYADWCEPCKVVSPIMEEISNENNDIEVFKVNIDDEPQLSKKLSIKSVPTIISFKCGEEYNRVVGAQSKAFILETLK